MREAKRRDAWRSNGFGRNVHWRSGASSAPAAAVSSWKSGPSHPVVRICETASIALGIMLVLVAGDFVLARHQITEPPQIARVNIAKPRLTVDSLAAIDRDELHSATDKSTLFGSDYPGAAEYLGPPARAAQAARAGTARYWWRAMRGVFLVWAGSLTAIVARAGSDDWAARALGLDPPGDTGLIPQRIRYEYDWDEDEWREV